MDHTQAALLGTIGGHLARTFIPYLVACWKRGLKVGDFKTSYLAPLFWSAWATIPASFNSVAYLPWAPAWALALLNAAAAYAGQDLVREAIRPFARREAGNELA